jgi:hypothetical protein
MRQSRRYGSVGGVDKSTFLPQPLDGPPLSLWRSREKTSPTAHSLNHSTSMRHQIGTKYLVIRNRQEVGLIGVFNLRTSGMERGADAAVEVAGSVTLMVCGAEVDFAPASISFAVIVSVLNGSPLPR